MFVHYIAGVQLGLLVDAVSNSQRKYNKVWQLIATDFQFPLT